MRILILLLCAATALHANGPFAFRDLGGRSLELSESGTPVFVYNYGAMLKEGVPADRERCCYVHPVYAPGGVVVTDDFPRDHYHHRGISWMWPIVLVDGQQFDIWALKGIHPRFVRWIARETAPTAARLAVENGWFAGTRKVVRETVEITAPPASANSRKLHFKLVFEALDKPVELSGEPIDKKGYGGFSFRFGPRKNTVIRTDTGLEAKDTNMVPHPWAELAGTFAAGRVAARVYVDPANPGAPNGWCLRHYGFLGVNFPGLDHYRLEPGKPLTLRYTVTLRPE